MRSINEWDFYIASYEANGNTNKASPLLPDSYYKEVGQKSLETWKRTGVQSKLANSLTISLLTM